MIESTVSFLRKKIEEHLNKINSSTNIIIDNIGICETAEGQRLADKIVFTIINIEEETALRNLLPAHDRIDHFLPLHFKLSVLITFNFPKNYLLALTQADNILQFLKSSPAFYPDEEKEHYLHFTSHLALLNLEEIKNLWCSLGVKQLPFLLYQLKVTKEVKKEE